MMTAEKLAKECIKCGDIHILLVNGKDFEAWQEGALIQNAMPYLGADEREILISGICGRCFDGLFGDDYEDDDSDEPWPGYEDRA